jgi:hypothetical protein
MITITNTVSTSTGDDKSNLFGVIVFHTQELLVTGNVQCELSFYKSEADKAAGSDKIYPIVNDDKITNCTIQCAVSDVIKDSGESTMADVVTYFNSKVKAKLEGDYGWSVSI